MSEAAEDTTAVRLAKIEGLLLSNSAMADVRIANHERHDDERFGLLDKKVDQVLIVLERQDTRSAATKVEQDQKIEKLSQRLLLLMFAVGVGVAGAGAAQRVIDLVLR